MQQMSTRNAYLHLYAIYYQNVNACLRTLRTFDLSMMTVMILQSKKFIFSLISLFVKQEQSYLKKEKKYIYNQDYFQENFFLLVEKYNLAAVSKFVATYTHI